MLTIIFFISLYSIITNLGKILTNKFERDDWNKLIEEGKIERNRKVNINLSIIKDIFIILLSNQLLILMIIVRLILFICDWIKFSWS